MKNRTATTRRTTEPGSTDKATTNRRRRKKEALTPPGTARKSAVCPSGYSLFIHDPQALKAQFGGKKQ